MLAVLYSGTPAVHGMLTGSMHPCVSSVRARWGDYDELHSFAEERDHDHNYSDVRVTERYSEIFYTL